MRERIKINNEPISEELFARCFWEIWDRLEATKPAQNSPDSRSRDGKPVYFHYLTLMALHCFLTEKVGAAVIECGIGGEYDTTNVLVRPTVTGVTSLGIDHESLLGDTIESIAWHKAGIFKQDVPAFTVLQPEAALKVLHDRAKEKGTAIHVVPQHSALDSIEVGLQGEFQKINASLAIAVSAQHLQRLGYNNLPSPIDNTATLPQEFITGLESARLGGRCDMRPDTKMQGLTWYIDGGHTLESIDVAGRWFASTINQIATSNSNERSTRILIFNQQTRDAYTLAKRFHTTLAAALNDANPFKHVIFCPNITYKEAGYKADLVSINTNKHDIDSLKVQQELARSWDRIDPEAEVHVVGTIEEAVARARELACKTDERAEVMATGSLHLIGGLIEVLEAEKENETARL